MQRIPVKIIANHTYHIYNQGNNRERIFYSNTHYLVFLSLAKKFISPHCKLLAYCLMPNHFHFLVYATEQSAMIKKVGTLDSCYLSNGFRIVQSNYALYINKERGRTGSLFRQKAKAKCVNNDNEDNSLAVLAYIHENPVKAGLVLRMEDWPYSSYAEYTGLRTNGICDTLFLTGWQ